MRLYLFFVLVVAASCSRSQAETSDLRARVDAYIETYQEREDWEAFLSFYSDTLYMKDVNLKLECNGLDAFKAFYDWPNPDFEKLFPEQPTFEVDQVVLQDQTAVIRGRFLPFYWKGERQDWAGDFSIWLLFDQEQKIVRQYDYIVYPPQFLGGS